MKNTIKTLYLLILVSGTSLGTMAGLRNAATKTWGYFRKPPVPINSFAFARETKPYNPNLAQQQTWWRRTFTGEEYPYGYSQYKRDVAATKNAFGINTAGILTTLGLAGIASYIASEYKKQTQKKELDDIITRIKPRNAPIDVEVPMTGYSFLEGPTGSIPITEHVFIPKATNYGTLRPARGLRDIVKKIEYPIFYSCEPHPPVIAQSPTTIPKSEQNTESYTSSPTPQLSYSPYGYAIANREGIAFLEIENSGDATGLTVRRVYAVYPNGNRVLVDSTIGREPHGLVPDPVTYPIGDLK